MSGDAESSAQALERFITAQLEGLSLVVPSDDVEMMARFVEEDGMEREEKVEGVRGMLEGVVEGGELPATGVDEALDHIVDEFERLKAEDEAAAEAARERTPTPPPDTAAVLASLTEEELKAARKAALLRQYGYVEGGPEDDPLSRGGAPPRGSAAQESEEKKKAEERRRLVEEALRLDGRKKKHRKQESGCARRFKLTPVTDPLQWENLNKDKVNIANQLQREAAKKGAQDKKERDRLALEKQRCVWGRGWADAQRRPGKGKGRQAEEGAEAGAAGVARDAAASAPWATLPYALLGSEGRRGGAAAALGRPGRGR
ncbi:hypothetical protein Q8F55_005677 [Vanrija albida]|uniref:Ribosomal RNA-processing protein 14/surfeit locus protein 6 C-terminal domain-containing protein n=1 Tax=Vanrija albida TaxID=181172 RepID=A0ABR3Q2A2_9TREE